MSTEGKSFRHATLSTMLRPLGKSELSITNYEALQSCYNPDPTIFTKHLEKFLADAINWL